MIMNGETNSSLVDKKSTWSVFKKCFVGLFSCLVLLLVTASMTQAQPHGPMLSFPKTPHQSHMKSLVSVNLLSYLCMAGVVMPATGVPRCQLFLKGIGLSFLILSATVIPE